jgi:hypothetical protein
MSNTSWLQVATTPLTAAWPWARKARCVALGEETAGRWWLDSGSLLGAVRGGGMIAHDYDIDFGINFDVGEGEGQGEGEDAPVLVLERLAAQLRPHLAPDTSCEVFLRAAGQFSDKLHVFREADGKHPCADTVDPSAGPWWRSAIDVQLYVEKPGVASGGGGGGNGGGGVVYMSYSRPDADYFGKVPLPARTLRHLGSVVFEGKAYPAPDQPHDYLEALYGYLGQGARFNPDTCLYDAPLPPN